MSLNIKHKLKKKSLPKSRSLAVWFVDCILAVSLKNKILSNSFLINSKLGSNSKNSLTAPLPCGWAQKKKQFWNKIWIMPRKSWEILLTCCAEKKVSMLNFRLKKIYYAEWNNFQANNNEKRQQHTHTPGPLENTDKNVSRFQVIKWTVIVLPFSANQDKTNTSYSFH